jgi:hypothetical protein
VDGGNAQEHILQIVEGLDSHEPKALDERIEEGGTPGALEAACEEPVVNSSVRTDTIFQDKNRQDVRQTAWHGREGAVPRGRMLDAMERSAIKLFKHRGLSNVAIAMSWGRHRTAVTAALEDPAEVRRHRQRSSQVDRWRAEVETWLTRGTPVRRM